MNLSPDARRIVAQFRLVGARGLTRVDFSAPDVIDGGKPIMNFNARIFEIKRAYGEQALRALPGRRNRCKVWVLSEHAQILDPDVRLRCDRGHEWAGRCRYDRAGYPMLAGAGPDCPTCARPVYALEAVVRPARADVVAAAHDLPAAA